MSQISWTLQNFGQLLKLCIAERDILAGKSLHALYLKSLIPNSTYLSNHFILFYSKCGSLSSARSAFDRTPKPNIFSFNAIVAAYAKASLHGIARQLFDQIPHPDLVSYNTLISSYADCGETIQAVRLFGVLRGASGIAVDGFTFSAAIGACDGDVRLVTQLHSLAVSGGFDSFSSVSNSLVTCYGRNGFWEEAERVFGAMGEGRDLVSWNAMIAAFGRCGKGLKALGLFREMGRKGLRVDVFTWASVLGAFSSSEHLICGLQLHAEVVKEGLNRNSHVGSGLIDLYSKFSSGVSEIRKVFEEVNHPDLVLWNTMISAYSQNEEFSVAAVDSFRQMQRFGHCPDDCSFSCAISSCANLSSPSQGRQIHSLAIKSKIPSNRISVNNALISMYSKCGNLRDARKIFDRMFERNTSTLNSMIAGYAQHGFGMESLRLFEDMIRVNIAPTSITFISVLSACAHIGKVEEGQNYFVEMAEKFGIKPDSSHYSSLIDLLGRAGKLEEAEKVIKTMPFTPPVSAWAALLSGCKKYGNIELALTAANQIMQLDPSNAFPYVVLSNMYACAGKWGKVSEVRKLMRDQGVRKKPGCSWIEVNKRVNYFVAQDSSHPLIREICAYLEEMLKRIELAGYVLDARFAMVKEDEAVEGEMNVRLGHHSEKLAVAFGIMSTRDGESILIAKNLRICGDCHNAIKYISAETGREITVRDNYRFHCFKQGQCSCGDYW